MRRSTAFRSVSRNVPVFSLIAGVAWIAKDVGVRVTPDPDYWDCNSSYDYILNAIDTVAFLALAFALVGVHSMVRIGMGGRRAIFGLIAAGALAVAGTANVLEHCAGADALGFAYVIGLMVGLVSLLVFSLFLTRVEAPSWPAWLVAAGTVLGLLFFNQGGLIAFGASLIAFGAARTRGSLAQEKARPKPGPETVN